MLSASGVAACVALAIPAFAAADCTIADGTAASPADATMGNLQEVSGTFTADQQNRFVLIPFDVPAGTTGVRVRYCFDSPGVPGAPSHTLDLGVYEPKPAGAAFWGPAERRGWSGSAVRDVAISVNGFSSEARYLQQTVPGTSEKKYYVHGRTTRAYRPGAIPAGQWAVELGTAAITAPPVDPNGVDYRVRFETSTSTDWNDTPYNAVPYDTSPENATAGWYSGDLHVHGEQEPGNATTTQTLNQAFGPLGPTGSGLDFVTLVDHNNDIALQGEVGKYQPLYPGKLIIPGVEVTTYKGHFNNQDEKLFVDYRTAPVFERQTDGSLTQVRGAVAPSSILGPASAAGGLAQINHPTTFPEAQFGPVCRGCAWDYSDADTGYSNVDAIEIQNGPGTLGTAPNPFTESAIAFYERALATGAHIAAVGSSDSHQATAGDATTAPVGGVVTMVYADALSEAAVNRAIRQDRTYVKLRGSNGPDIRLSLDAISPKTGAGGGSPDASIGDSLTAPAAQLSAQVPNGGPGGPRPGTYDLQILRDGAPIETAAVSAGDFTKQLDITETGRYSVKVVRNDGGNAFVEVYSSPIWFTAAKASNKFGVGKLSRNRKSGTATLTVKVPNAGKVTLSGKKLKKTQATAKAAASFNRTVKVKIRPKSSLAKVLGRKGTAKTSFKVTFTPTYGDPRSKSRKVTLQRQKPRR